MTSKKPPKTSITSLAVLVLGRGVQLGCLVAIYFGCTNLSELGESITVWKQRNNSLSAVCGPILRVTVPVWLGVAVLYFSERSLRRDRTISRRLRENPNKPWLANPDWEGDSIKTTNKNAWRHFAMGMTSMMLIGLPIAGLFWSESTLFMICIILVLLSLSFSATQWRWRAWTKANLKMSTMPGIIGGPLTGFVRIQRDFSSNTIFSCSLQCTYLLPNSGSDESDNTRRIHWSSSIEIERTANSSRGLTDVPIHFSIPYSSPDSMIVPVPQSPMRDVRWELMVHEKDFPSRGIAKFEVPVFKTRQSDFHYSPAPELLEDFKPSYDVADILVKFQFSEFDSGDGSTTMTYRFRDRSIWKMATLGMAGCIAIIVLFVLSIPILGIALFLSILPMVIIVAIAINMFEYWFWKGRILRNGELLTFECGIPRIHAPIQCLANKETKLICELDVRSQNQVLDAWNLSLLAADGTKRLLIRQVGSQIETETVQQWMAERLGIGTEQITMESGYADLSNAAATATRSTPSKKFQDSRTRNNKKTHRSRK